MSKNESLWKLTAKMKSHPALEHDIQCDVLVIGAGISGVLTAYFLSCNGVDTVLVDSKKVCSGQTYCTTAKITSQHGACYHKIAQSYSLDVAKLYARANETAISDFEKLIFDNNIRCDFEYVPSYLYSVASMDELNKEFFLARKCEIDATLTKRVELPFDVKLALCYKNQAQFNPYPFMAFFSEKLKVFENTHVNRVEDDVAYCGEHKIKANKIVFATHYPIVNFPGMYFLRMHQSRSYVVVLKNAPKISGLYYCVDKGGLSFRSYRDFLLVSGASHRTGEKPTTSPYDYLTKRAQEFYPDGRVFCKFSAQDCMSPDDLPYAGLYSKKRSNWYVLSGFSKWGMTNSMLSAKLVSDMICDVKNPLEDILSPSRASLPVTKAVLNETSHAIKNLSKSAFSIPPSNVKDIKRGEGKIVVYNGKKCAVYKSDDDKVYALSACCSHLGCQLSFNSEEKTWDCPCHGSRYSYTGELLNSPAKSSLKRYQ